MKSLLQRFWANRNGATAIEYGIIIAFLSITVVGAITGLGNQLYNIMGSATNAINH
jgi:pilus assembly protein Flp/PilA